MRLRDAAAIALVLASCASPARTQTTPDHCSALLKPDVRQLPNATTVIETAVHNSARTAQGNIPAAREHCEIVGHMNERIGFNSQRFAIRFHMRLPDQWNERFFFEGGGGTNGNLGTAYGNLQGSQKDNALSRGFAVVTQDSGHDNIVNNDPNLDGAAAFAFDNQARIDYGYNSYDQVTRLAKALIRLYYGRAPAKSYFAGCSEGGREALIMTQKYPDYFDGVLACAPGIHIPRALIAQAWNYQRLAEAAKSIGIYDKDGVPFVNKTFTDEDLALVANTVLEACDALDGAKDGIVSAFIECNAAAVRPKLSAVTCKTDKRTACLSAMQVKALERLMAGPKNSSGEVLYSDWLWDSGIGGKSGDNWFQGWRVWALGPYDAKSASGVDTSLVAIAAAGMASPPQAIRAYGPDPARFLLDYDLDTAIERLQMKNAAYTPSVWDMMEMGGTDLSAFRNRGGRLIVAHGVSDPIFSIKDTIAWIEAVNKAQNGRSADFVRLFAVPGMNHCAGGPATDQFDALGALVEWVEKGTAPDRILATAGNSTPWPGRTRPLCAYPKMAHYKGSGSLEDASNFVCQ